jgi:ubiquinone/menaquinone biosynthesis C-methylase UbiE
MLELRTLTDVNNSDSLSNQMRAKRFEFFQQLAAPLPRPLSIIDIGGTPQFWERCGWADVDDIHITIVNLKSSECKHSNIEIKIGDATNLADYSDRSFDIAFSNSAIEHLFTPENQAAMAREVKRVGRAYWVQTPNYWFPIEPHFQFLGWQWLPTAVRVAIVRRYACGRRGPYPDLEQARKNVKEIRLMTRRELSQLFPNASVWSEKFYGLVKSWVVYGGFPAQAR